MQIVLIIAGALLGAMVGEWSSPAFGLVLGAAVGFLISEALTARRRIAELAGEIANLRMKADREARQSEPAPLGETHDDSARHDARSPLPQTPGSFASRDERSPLAESPDSFARNRTIEPASAGQTRAQPARAPTLAEARAEAADSATDAPTAEHAPSAPSVDPPRKWRPPPLPPEAAFIRIIREYFTGGNTLVRVGIIILIFGVAFLLRYVAERTQVPIEFRLLGVAVGALVLLVLGWRLRTRRVGFALALQGGAVAILYLIVFAALRLYSVLPPTAAFVLLVLIVAFSSALAILQNSIELAVIGIVGGFLAPILASTGQGSHVTLFSYYAILNAGIVAIAWFKAWRILNVVGFVFTFAIGIAWGVLRYQSEWFASTEPFLVLFFLFYVAIAVLFAARQPPQLKGYVDGTIVFGAPIVAFSAQTALLHDRPYALAFSALAVSALYVLLATVLYRLRRDHYRLLVESFLALGVAFLTLAIPLALDGQWSAASWALEGAALVWVGCRQQRKLPRAAGVVLQFASGLLFWRGLNIPDDGIPLLNSACIGALIISGAALFTVITLHRRRESLASYERWAAPVLFFWSVFWWLSATLTELRHVPDDYRIAGGLILFALTALGSSELHRRFDLGFARFPVFALLPVMALFAAVAASGLDHPADDGGWLAWPIAFALLYFLIRRHEGSRILHAGAAWLLVALLTWEVAWAVDYLVQGGGSWPAIAWALVPAAALCVLFKVEQREFWPINAHRETYAVIVGGGIALYLLLWVIFTNLTLRGDPDPLPFVPLLNPLDIAEAGALLVLVLFVQRSSLGQAPKFYAVLAAVAFLWLNAVLVRTLHHWAGIPFDLESMTSSTLAQTAVSIFWTVIALATMLFATRQGRRVVWLTGAALLAAVVLKLFVIDLSRVESIERIVSFVGVGVLMLVIGYFSPLPPAAKEAK